MSKRVDSLNSLCELPPTACPASPALWAITPFPARVGESRGLFSLRRQARTISKHSMRMGEAA
jgi:hypothetical protein